MKISVGKLVAFCWALSLACVGLMLLPYAVAGDQQFYRGFYESVPGLSLDQGYAFYKNQLGTSEPGYFLLMYLLSPWLPKDVVIGFLNFVLYYHVFLWLRRQRVSMLLYPLLACNFYLMVLSFSAERVKLALVFFLVGYSLRGVLRYLALGLSLVTQVQMLLLLLGARVEGVLAVCRQLARGRVGSGFVSMLLTLLGGLVLLLLLREHIASKFSHYAGVWGGATALIKPLIFTAMTLFYARGRVLEAFLVSLPMVVAAYFIGSERVVIFSYFVFMFYAAPYRRGLNLGVVAASGFFAYGGIGFLRRMVEFGDGFAGIY